MLLVVSSVLAGSVVIGRGSQAGFQMWYSHTGVKQPSHAQKGIHYLHSKMNKSMDLHSSMNLPHFSVFQWQGVVTLTQQLVLTTPNKLA